MHLLSVFSLRNRALIALLTIVVAVFGAVALGQLKQELFPSLSLPQITVISSYQGASPQVVENDVSTPIEDAIQGVEGLDSTHSSSRSGQSTVTAAFVYGTNLTTAEQKVQLAVDRLQSRLPDGVTPQVIAFSISDLPVIQLAVTSDLDPATLASRLQDSAVTDLQQLEGVRAASVLGDRGQRITITPDTVKLAQAGLSTQAITSALQQNGILLASGSITSGDKTLDVQAGQRIASTDQLAALPLVGARVAPGTAVPTIGDVATVKTVPNPVAGISRVNGKAALTVSISKTPAGNTVDVSRAVNAEIPKLEKDLGSHTKFTVVFDQAPYIEQSINSLAEEGALGLLFAVIVILLFLLSFRSTIVTAISIPVSLLIAFVVMWGVGYTLNVLTLGAITIAVGRVVDDSIVVIENIKRHLTLGEEKLTAITTAVREVAVAVTASTVTTVAVFLPIALVGDITGELFRPFALTVTIALLASLFVALTIVPVLAFWFLKESPRAHPHRHDAAAGESGGRPTDDGGARAADELDRPTALQRGYLPIIRWTTRFRWVTVVLAVVVLVGSAALGGLLTTNFIGSSGQNTLTVTETLPPSTSLEASDTAATKVEKALRGVDGVTTVQTSIGSSGGGIAAAFGRGGGVTFSITTDPSKDQDRIQSDVRSAVKKLNGVGEVDLSSGSGGFGGTDIEVDVQSSSARDLQTAADDILARLTKLPQAAQVTSDLSATQPYLAIKVDRAQAAKVGLSEVAVGRLVSQAMLPTSVGSVELDDRTLNIYITDPKAPTTIDALKAFEVPTAAGPVALGDLATVEQVNGPASISTERGQRTATVTVTPKTADLGTASAEVQKAVDKVKLPSGTTASLGGATQDQANAFSQLGLALLAAILIVYTVMVATFRSLRQPLLLLASVPFAATGAIVLQYLSGIPLGAASLIGVLMLIGIVVTNAIVLIDLVNQYRRRGMDVQDAVVHGAARRLRPILMTALATIFALLPMAIGLTGHGGFISQPLAIVVIGGLVSSTLLTLIVLPSLYVLVEGARERRGQYPPLRRSIATRIVAIAGLVVLAAGVVLAVLARTAWGLGLTSRGFRGALLLAEVGAAALVAAAFVYLVRAGLNRRRARREQHPDVVQELPSA
ncbi:efflux RND transporter permease subunit [Pseudolysinimonas kribbensis]|uniref:Hydrogenase expression protein n=1 Tax=Pseudolysinimonas kribbensis TaxID=433641 RepID=A0ABQ6K4H2_9MICO|nr:efflux RND transporter permease subunit [Pseudolysinimonas kribbensis]GMA95333.1 hydrogenase expression protein [Pseudolysinimonas kribbensis]